MAMTSGAERGNANQTNNQGSLQTSEPDFICIGKIHRSHGIRGDVVLDPMTDFPECHRAEYNNLDSLLGVVLRTEDVASYDKLRLLVSADSLFPVAIEMADKTHYPIACYDVYYSSVQGLRLPQDEFDFAYKYLNEAADSMYYPAVYLKACLCLTGVYFSPDTILGKKLLEQCHGSTSIPFWQQYYRYYSIYFRRSFRILCTKYKYKYKY